jgi:hypothetical protein
MKCNYCFPSADAAIRQVDAELEIPGYDFTVPLRFRQQLPLPTYDEVLAALQERLRSDAP